MLEIWNLRNFKLGLVDLARNYDSRKVRLQSFQISQNHEFHKVTNFRLHKFQVSKTKNMIRFQKTIISDISGFGAPKFHTLPRFRYFEYHGFQGPTISVEHRTASRGIGKGKGVDLSLDLPLDLPLNFH